MKATNTSFFFVSGLLPYPCIELINLSKRLALEPFGKDRKFASDHPLSDCQCGEFQDALGFLEPGQGGGSGRIAGLSHQVCVYHKGRDSFPFGFCETLYGNHVIRSANVGIDLQDPRASFRFEFHANQVHLSPFLIDNFSQILVDAVDDEVKLLGVALQIANDRCQVFGIRLVGFGDGGESVAGLALGQEDVIIVEERGAEAIPSSRSPLDFGCHIQPIVSGCGNGTVRSRSARRHFGGGCPGCFLRH